MQQQQQQQQQQPLQQQKQQQQQQQQQRCRPQTRQIVHTSMFYIWVHDAFSRQKYPSPVGYIISSGNPDEGGGRRAAEDIFEVIPDTTGWHLSWAANFPNQRGNKCKKECIRILHREQKNKTFSMDLLEH